MLEERGADCLAEQPKKEKGKICSEPQKEKLSVRQVAKLAAEAGMSYGKYVQKHKL